MVSRWFPPKHHGNQRYLIISTTGVGDTIWATPALEALKGVDVTLLTTPIGKQLLLHNPNIDRFFTLKDRFLFFKLRKCKFEKIIIFHASQRPVFLLASILGAGVVVGTEGLSKGLDDLLTTAVPNNQVHEIDRRLALTKACQLPSPSVPLKFHFSPNEHSSLSHKYFLFQPGSHDCFKQWPLESFAKLGNKLCKYGEVIIIGSPKERAMAERLAGEIYGARSVAGKLSIRKIAKMIEGARGIVTNDTGPMHLAFALNVPTWALFSPTSPKRCGPYMAKNAHVIAKPTTCNPCIKKRCADPFCMRQISPNSVYESIYSALELERQE